LIEAKFIIEPNTSYDEIICIYLLHFINKIKKHTILDLFSTIRYISLLKKQILPQPNLKNDHK